MSRQGTPFHAGNEKMKLTKIYGDSAGKKPFSVSKCMKKTFLGIKVHNSSGNFTSLIFSWYFEENHFFYVVPGFGDFCGSHLNKIDGLHSKTSRIYRNMIIFWGCRK